jgi:osmoprotectant transport system permease protein
VTYLLANGPMVWRLTVEHLEIAGLACLFAILVGCPLGVVLSRVAWLWGPVLGAAGAFYTVPSIALFAALIPFLGLGTRPTVVALVLYCQLPLIRNTAVGLKEVDRSLIEAAEGMGMTRSQRFWRVQFPLAVPVIVAGIRMVVVMAIGMATVAAYIGAGGLGTLIFQGIATDHTDQVLAGALVVSAVALAADGILALVQRSVGSANGVTGWAS